MTVDRIAEILWRRRLAFLLAFAAAIGAVVAVTLVLPRVYTATATLYVGGRIDPESFVDTGLAEQHTRTYANLAGNPNVAQLVVDELELVLTRQQLLDRMSFAPVERAPLLLISAEGDSPEEAARIANAYAETFVERMSDLFIVGRAPAEIAVSEPAATPSGPSKPNPPLYIGFGALLSFFLALGYALLRERLDTRLRVGAADESVLGLPVMARIPRIAIRDGRVGRETADRFGLLKTNVDFVDELPARVLLVTSPGVDEGKSTVSANLALACAADGERVVLVEADLRRPGLAATVGSRARSSVGLSNYLAGAASEEEIVNRHPADPSLSVIWAGHLPPNPAALLGSERLDTLLGLLRLDFDRIVIDTCPILVGADASVIALRVDGTLYVIDEDKTRWRDAQAGLNQLRGVRARLLGVVLNRATLPSRDGYYYGEPPEVDEPKTAERVRASSEGFS